MRTDILFILVPLLLVGCVPMPGDDGTGGDPPSGNPLDNDGTGQTGACGPGADPVCDFCWVTDNEVLCPEEFNSDGDCDCGCQFQDQACRDVDPNCDCDLIYESAINAVNNDDECTTAEVLLEPLNCNCCSFIQELCYPFTEEELLGLLESECGPNGDDPPEDTCPSGCRRGSVCCGFPFCAGDCIGSPCCT